MALNVHRLWQVHRVMQLSLAKTLANKHRTSINTIFHKYRVKARHDFLYIYAE
jgi:hypothetical protein